MKPRQRHQICDNTDCMNYQEEMKDHSEFCFTHSLAYMYTSTALRNVLCKHIRESDNIERNYG